MNHTKLAVIIIVSTLMIVGTSLAALPPLQQQANASLKHPLKNQLLNQQFLCYRSPGCHGQNLAMQNLGKGNSITGWGDQSSNIQQNQTTQQQQQPQPSSSINSNSVQRIPVGISLPH